MADLTLSTLCVACKAIFAWDSPKNDSGEVTHHGITDLGARATRGCNLCLTVYMSLDPEALSRFRKAHHSSQGYAWISPIARDQARLKFRYVGAPSDGGGATPSSFRSTATSLLPGAAANPLIVELILVKPEYAVEPGVKTIGFSSTSTGSMEALDAAKQWLDDCSFNHMKCSVTDPNMVWKPTHLLDISIKGPKGAPGVKLVDGMFLDPLAEYVTLSHCWGHGRPTRLTKKTLPALRQGVATTTLPKTFAEAAMATERLGFRYLWIDALCIMHDNEAAVLHEISQMNRVYSEATLNLAATSSRDDTAGLFYSRNVAALQPCTVIVAGHGVDDGIYKCLRSTVWHDLVHSSPLSKRAWVFQERCLAKRTLHFTRNEVLWECQQMCCSEVFPKGLPANMGAPTAQDSDDVFNKRYHHQKTGNWHTLVKMYSQGRLTFNTDKLLAMSGVAKQYMSRNRLREEDYIAGLWKSHLPHALLWRIEKGRGSPRYRAPSWSWASLDGTVHYPEPAQLSKETCVEVIEAHTDTKGDAMGLVERGHLRLRGFMIKGTLKRTQEYYGQTSCVLDCMTSSVDFESASFDERLPKLSQPDGPFVEQLEVYCVPIVDTVDHVEGLFLCATMKNKGEFRRIGAFDISRYDQTAWDRFKENMKGDPNLLNYEARLDHKNGYWFASDYTYTISIV